MKLLLLFFLSLINDSECPCYEDTMMAIETIAADYAGYEYHIRRRGQNQHDTLVAAVLSEAKTIDTKKDCEINLKKYIAFFEDFHHMLVDEEQLEKFERPSPLPNVKTFIEDSVVYLKIPSFHPKVKPSLDSLIQVHKAALETFPYIIVDISNNDGGGEGTYKNLEPYIYHRDSIRSYGAYFKKSNGNLEHYKSYLDYDGFDEETREAIIKDINHIEQSNEHFVYFPGSTSYIEGGRTIPAKIAIIITDAVSAGEGFILEMRQAKNTTTFGGNSRGGRDFFENRWIHTPLFKMTIALPMKKAGYLNEFIVDPDGITPDIEINLDTDWNENIKKIVPYLNK